MKTFTVATLAAVVLGCSGGNTGTTGAGLVAHPNVPGTIFTIVFENEDTTNVLAPENKYFSELAAKYARPLEYTSSTHPSLPNYIMMTSGTLNGVTTDSDPAYNVTIPGSNNIADQLDAAAVPWRAYMESMGDPCTTETSDLYSAHHNPFLYYWSMRMNPSRCQSKLVDFDANFANDLAANTYRYMWITPNMCNDVHNCPVSTGDAWLQKVIPQIMASPGYQNGGAIFILFDEGSLRVFGASTELPVIVISPQLVSAPYQTTTPFTHASYLATVEDILDLPRLPATADVTSMDEMFIADDQSNDAGIDATPP